MCRDVRANPVHHVSKTEANVTMPLFSPIYLGQCSHSGQNDLPEGQHKLPGDHGKNNERAFIKMLLLYCGGSSNDCSFLLLQPGDLGWGRHHHLNSSVISKLRKKKKKNTLSSYRRLHCFENKEILSSVHRRFVLNTETMHHVTKVTFKKTGTLLGLI